MPTANEAKMYDDQLVQWVICTSLEYHSMESHAENKLYFLYDTEEFYRGEIPFATSIIFYDGERPATGAKRKIYVDSTTLNGYVYDGYWQQILTQYEIVDEVLDNTSDDAIPNVEALRRFIETAISDMRYNPVSHSIEYTQGNLVKAVVIDGLMIEARFNDATNCLEFYDVNKDIISSVKLPKDKALTKVKYDPATKNIIFTITDVDGGGEPMELVMPAQDLIAIPISKEEGNILQEKPDGYYVTIDLSGKMDKIVIRSDEDIGGVIVSANDGNARPTRYQIGGPHLSLEELPEGGEQPKDNLLATEQAVYNFITDLKKAVEVVAAWAKVNIVNKDNPNANNITSEVAVASIWKELETSINNLDDALSTRIESANSAITDNSSAIEDIKSNIDAITSSSSDSFNEIDGKLTDLSDKITSNSNNIQNNAGDISTLQISLNTLRQSISELQSNVTNLSSTHSIDIQNINTNISSINDRISDLASQQSNSENAIYTSMQEAVDDINASINAISARVTALETKMAEVEASKIKVYT